MYRAFFLFLGALRIIIIVAVAAATGFTAVRGQRGVINVSGCTDYRQGVFVSRTFVLGKLRTSSRESTASDATGYGQFCNFVRHLTIWGARGQHQAIFFPVAIH